MPHASGVSYMLENREIMMRMFPGLFRNNRIEPVDQYPELLRRTLASVAPAKCEGTPTIVILTPGHYNSAYYEHSFLANLMGVELVEGSDLFVDKGFVYMRTGAYLSASMSSIAASTTPSSTPLCFRPDSMLGVPGLMDVYRSGGVSHLFGARRGGGGRQGDLYLCAGNGALLSGRRADPEQRPDLDPVEGRRLQIRHGQPRDLVVKGGPRLGRLRRAGRPEIPRDEIETFRRKDRGRSRQLHRPADAGAVHLSRHSSTGSRRAMSICGPIACAATGSSWCRGLTRVAARGAWS